MPDLAISVFRAGEPQSQIKRGNKPPAFRTTGQKIDVDLVPLNSLFDRRYAVYWQVS